MLFDLSAAVGGLATGAYQVKRKGTGDYFDGRYSPGDETTLTVTAVVHPVSGRERVVLPEGIRNRETVAVYTTEALRTDDAPDGAGADILVYGGREFTVVTVEDWSALGGFWKALAVKRDQ